MSGFVTQLLDGDYRSFSEDRLTQLTAASINHSRAFRRCFLQFLGLSKRDFLADNNAETQTAVWYRQELGRLDLVINRHRRTVAIVENKVDATLFPKQLRNYSAASELRLAKKFALVRDFFSAGSAFDGWKILHWRDFYLALCHLLQSQKRVADIDRFIIQNFIEYLEEANMHVPTRISKAAMNGLAKTLHGLRYVEETNYRWFALKADVFQTAADWVRMMEAIFQDSRADTRIAKAARKNYRFSPQVGHWWEQRRGKSKAYRWIGIHAQVCFPKPRGRTKTLGIGLFVNDNKVWSIIAFRNWTVSDRIDECKLADSHSDVVLADLTRKVLKKWKSWTS